MVLAFIAACAIILGITLFAFGFAFLMFDRSSLAMTVIYGIMITLAGWFVMRMAERLAHPRVVPPGICIGCGYDLRGIDSERCSECGCEIVKEKPALSPIETTP